MTDTNIEQAQDATAPKGKANLQPLIESITQREKFLLADRLGRPFHELMEDPDRVMIALLWVKRKRDNAGIGPNFDELLDLTDGQIIDGLGLSDNSSDDDDDQAASGQGNG